MLSIEQLSLAGVDAPRLENLQLHLEGGQLIGIVGANGAGKSSLLQVIAGVLKPTMGQIRINSTPINELNPRQKAEVMAYLPQSEQPQWDITVTELVAIGLLHYPGTRQQRQQLISDALAHCDLQRLAERQLSTLSGGERQRALLARALAAEPQLLLCDEPTTGLDIQHQLQTMTLLKQRAQQGQLVLCCLHDLSLAARYCDQLVLLKQGKHVAAGAPARVLSDDNLADALGIRAQWFCDAGGVAWIPQPLADRD